MFTNCHTSRSRSRTRIGRHMASRAPPRMTAAASIRRTHLKEVGTHTLGHLIRTTGGTTRSPYMMVAASRAMGATIPWPRTGAAEWAIQEGHPCIQHPCRTTVEASI